MVKSSCFVFVFVFVSDVYLIVGKLVLKKERESKKDLEAFRMKY